MTPVPGMLAPVQQCRSCRAPIVWSVTKHAGKRLPLNPKPSPMGNVRVELNSSVLYAELVLAAYREALLAEGQPLYVSHFATCPNAKNWRNRR